MASISNTRLQQVIDRFEEVEARMGATSDTAEIIALSKEHAELKPVAAKARELIASRNGLKEAEGLLSGSDKEMAELASLEIEELKEKLPGLEQEMQILLLPKDVDDTADIVLEIRAGTGGDEAAIFAGDLYRMYSRYRCVAGRCRRLQGDRRERVRRRRVRPYEMGKRRAPRAACAGDGNAGTYPHVRSDCCRSAGA